MQLLKNNDIIIRILEELDEKVLIIDCIKCTMPKWVAKTELEDYVEVEESSLYELTNMDMHRELNGEENKIARERFSLIAGVLPFVGVKKKRSFMIEQLSEEISKQTIRKYLCLYLAYQDISVLAPRRKKDKELSKDEKNIRWALNKYYYNAKKNSLKTAYVKMLKEKYCEGNGRLIDTYPTFHQFRYFYRKHKKMQNYYISRNGMKDYQRNYRPLLGDGVQSLAPAVGIAMLDTTVCDIYLINDAGAIVGRPLLTVCIDAYSSFCMGYALTWESGIYALNQLMLNVTVNKKAWCEKHGVLIETKEWNSNKLPGTLITDMGSEYKSENFAQITELGVKIINLPPYRPELKGSVEKFFDLIQSYFKKTLKGKGVVEPDFKQRGGHDYRKDACLTMTQFEQIILRCILYYNNRRIMANFPYTEEMIKSEIKPYACSIFEWGETQLGSNLIEVNQERLKHILLPRVIGIFKRNGLSVNGLRYKNDSYKENYLKGGTGLVAYNPDDVTQVYLIEKGDFIPFQLIEERFRGKSLKQVEVLTKQKRELVKMVQHENLQAQIDLEEHISTISNQSKPKNIKLTNIRDARKIEKTKRHVNLMKAGE